MLLIRGVVGHIKYFVKKRTEVHFSTFIENRNWDLEFVFRFDNENEKRKKTETQFHFKCPFRHLCTVRAPIFSVDQMSFWAPCKFFGTF